ncbi:predicted protein [Naegleria gruberi]|uniref:Ste24 endopeptidase n=1 Tax=Naegleria gruberi TaxID=5762 RepID=D2VX26_NAEGR|nr:uncharacterized protein NAEGRDRAFT_73593 [Naegleria gruberi]EFC38546.1 predicted protein [Naegleria gruberi]|eukprot:XP_002671290.1 predicted protein [Naegleria gruberi strain NEG-M]
MIHTYIAYYITILAKIVHQVPLPFLTITILSNAVAFFIELYLDYRQSKLLKTSNIPSKLQKYLDKDEFDDMRNYSILRLGFSRLENAYGFITEVVILLSGVLTWIFDLSLKINILLFSLGEEYAITRGVTFLFLVSLLSTLVRAPFEVYRIFVIDGKFFETKQERKDLQNSTLTNEDVAIFSHQQLLESSRSKLMQINNAKMFFGDEQGDNSVKSDEEETTSQYNEISNFKEDITSDNDSDGSEGGVQDIMTVFRNWIMDQIKMGIISVVIGTPLLFLILWLLTTGSPIHWVYMWVGSVALAVGIYELYPIILAPMFNTFYEMPEGPLRKSIEELTIKVGIPVKDIVYVDGSKRHENANAFMIGSGENKKIVLYDNLISKDGLNLTNDEILAILAHEIHHYKMNHSIKILTSQVFSLGIFLFILSFTIYNEYFYNSFGFTEIDPSVGLCLFSYLFQPLGNFAMVILNHIQRKYEYSSDEYSMSLGYNIEEPLIKMHVNNVYNLIVDRLYSSYYNAHPSLLERVDNLKKWIERNAQRQRLNEKLIKQE